MNWTRTPGYSSSRPGRTQLRPVHADPARLRAAARPRYALSPSSTFASSDTTCARSPSPAGCSRTRWSRGCAGAARRGACAWWSIAGPPGQANRRGQTPEQMLNIVCDRLCGGLANAGIQARRMAAADVHDWLLRWFNPRPTLLGPEAEDRERFYALARYPDADEARRDRAGERAGISASGFSSASHAPDVEHGTWHFDGMPHRVLITDRLRMPPGTGHLTGETRKGDAINTLFDQMPGRHLAVLYTDSTPAGCPRKRISTTWRRRPSASRWRRSRREGACRKPRSLIGQRPQALPGRRWRSTCAGATKRTGPARPGPGERDAQCWLAAGARGRRGGTA